MSEPKYRRDSGPLRAVGMTFEFISSSTLLGFRHPLSLFITFSPSAMSDIDFLQNLVNRYADFPKPARLPYHSLPLPVLRSQVKHTRALTSSTSFPFSVIPSRSRH